MTSVDTFRMAAAASLANAKDLCVEAKLLAENGHMSRAAALAVIGLEEFAKAVAYTLVGIFPEKSQGIQARLLKHEVKHWIADTFEGAQILTDEWPLIVFQETGSWLPAEEALRNIFVELARHGLDNLVPDLSVTKNHKRKMKSDNTDYIWTPYIKNAALYVDISDKGEILLPQRVERFANSEITGLTWYLEHIRPLREILSDQTRWVPFADDVRVRVS